MKRNSIKVFVPNSKRADFTVACVSTEAGARKVGEMLGEDTGASVRAAFRNLKRLGGESFTFRAQGRKIKVELAHAA